MDSQNRGYGFELVMVLVSICWLLYTVPFTPFGFKIVCFDFQLYQFFLKWAKGNLPLSLTIPML